MKNVFSNNIKIIGKKLLIALILVFSLTQMSPNTVHANDGMFGKLTEPFVDLLLSLGDGIVWAAHKFTVGQEQSKIYIDLRENGIIRGIIAFVVAAVVGICAVVLATCVLTGIGAIVSAVIAKFTTLTVSSITTTLISGAIVPVLVSAGAFTGLSVYNSEYWGDRLIVPIYAVSPDTILQGKIGLFNVDFFNDEKVDGELLGEDIAAKLRPTISGFYNVLRNIALAAMMAILVYIGIRILMSSTGANKAKYKQLLVDWIVGMCLLFVMHYGMSFANLFVNKITNALNAISETTQTVTIEYDSKIAKKIKQYNEDNENGLVIYDTSDESNSTEGANEDNWDIYIFKEGDTKYMICITNMMGKLRVNAEYAREENESYLGATFVYLVDVFLLVYFIFVYLRRVLYMAFLTLIAPFVAMTYPIDKIHDGQAQAFNFWLKEYIFNLLLQPLHLLIYTILVGSAIELATSNIIYSVVAIGFMVPAEKLLRQMFGFKGTTPGSIPSAAGGALMMTGMRNLLGFGPKEEKDVKQEKPAISGKPPVDTMENLVNLTGGTQEGEQMGSERIHNVLRDGNTEDSARENEQQNSNDRQLEAYDGPGAEWTNDTETYSRLQEYNMGAENQIANTGTVENVQLADYNGLGSQWSNIENSENTNLPPEGQEAYENLDSQWVDTENVGANTTSSENPNNSDIDDFYALNMVDSYEQPEGESGNIDNDDLKDSTSTTAVSSNEETSDFQDEGIYNIPEWTISDQAIAYGNSNGQSQNTNRTQAPNNATARPTSRRVQRTSSQGASEPVSAANPVGINSTGRNTPIEFSTPRADYISPLITPEAPQRTGRISSIRRAYRNRPIRPLQGAMGGLKSTGNNAGRKIAKIMKKAKPIRFTAGVIGGAMAATVGAAIGVAAGSPKDVLTNASVAGLAGYKAGRGVGNTVEHAAGSFRDGFLENAISPERREMNLRHEKYSQVMNDPDFVKTLKNNFTKEEMKELRKSKVRDRGTRFERRTSDLEELITRSGTRAPAVESVNAMGKMLLNPRNNINTIDEAISVYKTAERVGNFDDKGDDETISWEKRLYKDYEKAGIAGEEINVRVNKTKDLMKEYYSAKSSTKSY